jgi:hypothetical protein
MRINSHEETEHMSTRKKKRDKSRKLVKREIFQRKKKFSVKREILSLYNKEIL